MAATKQLLAIFIFLFMFVCDLYFDVESDWYVLLFCMLYLLFGVEPTKSLANLLVSFKSAGKKKEDNE